MVKRMSFHHILCPTDCSESSRPAMRRALSLARWFDARVTALHVTQVLALPHAGMTWAYSLGVTADDVEGARRDAARALERFMERYLSPDFPIEMVTAVGMSNSPWREITEQAATLPADLIVMGTHGRTGLDHLLLGSVAEKVLRHAPCPVIVVGGHDGHDAATPLFRRIVCATDLTPGSTATVETALSLAQENLARLVLLHVIEDVRGERSLDVYRPVPEGAAFRLTLAEQAKERLAELGADAHSFADVTRRVEAGRAWEEVVRVAGEQAADLIVIGAHTGGALGRRFLGSTADKIVSHAPCPVLIAREDRRVAGAVSIAPTRTGTAPTAPAS